LVLLNVIKHNLKAVIKALAASVKYPTGDQRPVTERSFPHYRMLCSIATFTSADNSEAQNLSTIFKRVWALRAKVSKSMLSP
jgi:hypothetical protein